MSLKSGCEGVAAINTIMSVMGVNLKTLHPEPCVEGLVFNYIYMATIIFHGFRGDNFDLITYGSSQVMFYISRVKVGMIQLPSGSKVVPSVYCILFG